MYQFELEGNYGYGWDLLTTEDTKADIITRKREYAVNEPGVALRIKRVKAVA